MASITLKGNPFNTSGELPAVGSAAPDFSLTTGELADVSLADYAGKKKLISIVPSLDTPVCALSTKKFNDHAASHDDCVVLTVSADLPFAQGRFCTAESVENVVTLTSCRGKGIGKRVMNAAIDLSWQAGCFKIMLMSGSGNLPFLSGFPFLFGCGFFGAFACVFFSHYDTPGLPIDKSGPCH